MKTLTQCLLLGAATLVLAACSGGGEDAPNDTDGTSVRDAAKAATTAQATISDADREQLRTMVVELIDQSAGANAEGFTATAGQTDQVAALQPAQSHSWTQQLKAGTQYRIIGACDAECGQMDIALADGSGRVVANDNTSDDYPVLEFTPTADGAFTAKMTMTACSLAPCYSAARFYEKAAG